MVQRRGQHLDQVAQEIRKWLYLDCYSYDQDKGPDQKEIQSVVEKESNFDQCHIWAIDQGINNKHNIWVDLDGRELILRRVRGTDEYPDVYILINTQLFVSIVWNKLYWR